jgi:chemotaxis protein histidine kinase CheA
VALLYQDAAKGAGATLGFMALSRIAKRVETSAATSSNAAPSVTVAELAAALTQTAETMKQSLSATPESGSTA